MGGGNRRVQKCPLRASADLKYNVQVVVIQMVTPISTTNFANKSFRKQIWGEKELEKIVNAEEAKSSENCFVSSQATQRA